MKIFLLQLCCIFAVAILCNAGVLEEIKALDKELGEQNSKRDAQKKSLKDMSTDELIEELKKEVNAAKKSASEKRSSFENVVEKYKSDRMKTEMELEDLVRNNDKRDKDALFRNEFLSIFEKDATKAEQKDLIGKLEKEMAAEERKRDSGSADSNKNDEFRKKFENIFKNSVDEKADHTVLREIENLDAEFQRKRKRESLTEKVKDILELLLQEKEKRDDAKNLLESFTISQQKDDTCKDTRDDCKRFLDYCDTKYRDYLTGQCDKTCKYCEPIVHCGDKFTQETCEKYKTLGRACETDKYRDLMENNCASTCGYCSVPAPAKCSKTRYGCCWDRMTTKETSDGENCKAIRCVDEYRNVCKNFRVDCPKNNDAGIFMRIHCPNSCNLCNNEQCIDDPIYQKTCPFWRDDLKWCKNNFDYMKYYCPKTCNIC